MSVIHFHGGPRGRAFVEIEDGATVRFFSIGNVVEVRSKGVTVGLHDSTCEFETMDGHEGIVNLSDLALRAAQSQGLLIEYIEDAYQRSPDG